jgi:DHA1 family bicyclomycin/chloramphenicol resistance-like MFS transporter
MSEQIRSARLATVIPLVFATGVSLLATDLYLPSIPLLPDALGGTLGQAQATLASFFITFALCQLLHGALAEAYGDFRVLIGAAAVFVVATVLAALAPDIATLTLARALQGGAAAAATAIAPAVIRRTYDEATSIRLMSWLGIAESVVPALAPLLGALVLVVFGWRANFWLLAGIAIVAVSFLVRNRHVYERERPNFAGGQSVWRDLIPNYRTVLSSRAFLAYGIGYASAYGALMTFVGIAPHLLQQVYGHGPESFGIMQIVMVAAFMAGSLLAGRAAEALGRERTIAAGFAGLAVTAVLMLLVAGGAIAGNAVTITIAMLPSQFGLGLRFGVAMSAAIGSVPQRPSSASAMVSFLCFLFAALGNAAVAMWVEHALSATALACLGFTMLSLGALLLTPRDAGTR